MSEMSYTYEVVSVDEQARVMEILYKSPGRSQMHISARLPFVDESFDAVVAMFAPTAYWREVETPTQTVQVGVVGSVAPVAELNDLGSVKQAKSEEIALWRFLQETSGTFTPSGMFVKTTRDSQAAISLAYAGLKDNVAASIGWKAGKSFVDIGLSEATEILQAVFGHVQRCFSAERELLGLVDAATTVEEVKAVSVPWPMPAVVNKDTTGVIEATSF